MLHERVTGTTYATFFFSFNQTTQHVHIDHFLPITGHPHVFHLGMRPLLQFRLRLDAFR